MRESRQREVFLAVFRDVGHSLSIRASACFLLQFRVSDLPPVLPPPLPCSRASTYLQFVFTTSMAEGEYLYPDALGLTLYREDVEHMIGHLSEAV